MKILQFISCLYLTLQTINGIRVYENSNLSKRSPTPYHSYIEFKDKRKGGGYGYKFQLEGNHVDEEKQWQQPNHEQEIKEEDKSYLPNNYEQIQAYTHHAPIPIHKQQNLFNNQDEQAESELQPEITFESSQGAIQHLKKNKVSLNNYLQETDANMQPFSNLYFPNNAHESNIQNSAPVKLSQLPIITKYVPFPVKYMPAAVKEPSRGHIKFASTLLNAASTKAEPVIIMNSNNELSPESMNSPVKYIMVPVQPSLDTKLENIYDENLPKQIQYQPNPIHQEHILYQQQQMPQQQILEENIPNNYFHQIKHNIPIKYMANSIKNINQGKDNMMHIPQNLDVKPIQFHFKNNHENVPKNIEQNYQNYLPNRLNHPIGDKQISHYLKTNIPKKNIFPVEGQPMYEYKTIQEEDYKNPQSSIEYEMLNLPKLINKLPANSMELQHKFAPQNIAAHPQQNYILSSNNPQEVNLGAVNNFQAISESNQQLKHITPGFAHDFMPNINFNLGIQRRSTKGRNMLRSSQKQIKHSGEYVINN